MKLRPTLWLALGLAAVALPAIAGQPPRPGRFGGPGAPPFDPEQLGERLELRAERLAEALDLTAEQRAGFDQLRADALAASEPKLERMRAAGEELRALLDAAPADAAAVGALVIEMHSLRGELRAERERVETGLEALLTDAQKLALKAVRETRPGPGPFRGPGPGPGPERPRHGWLGDPAD